MGTEEDALAKEKYLMLAMLLCIDIITIIPMPQIYIIYLYSLYGKFPHFQL